MTLIAAIRNRHNDHVARPKGECDACLLLDELAKAHAALDELQRMSSMGQWDPTAVAEAVRRARG